MFGLNIEMKEWWGGHGLPSDPNGCAPDVVSLFSFLVLATHSADWQNQFG